MLLEQELIENANKRIVDIRKSHFITKSTKKKGLRKQFNIIFLIPTKLSYGPIL